MVEILTLWCPNKLLKNLGPLTEYAKCSQSSIKKKKKKKSLLSILGTMEWSKTPSHATVPLTRVADPCHFNADPDPAFHFDADPDL